jgi:hypothetical protein
LRADVYPGGTYPAQRQEDPYARALNHERDLWAVAL